MRVAVWVAVALAGSAGCGADGGESTTAAFLRGGSGLVPQQVLVTMDGPVCTDAVERFRVEPACTDESMTAFVTWELDGPACLDPRATTATWGLPADPGDPATITVDLATVECGDEAAVDTERVATATFELPPTALQAPDGSRPAVEVSHAVDGAVTATETLRFTSEVGAWG